MYKAIETVHTINAPLNKIWPLIRSGEHWHLWFPIIDSTKYVEGNKRSLILSNQDLFEETFIISEIEKTFIYSVDKQKSFPANNIVGLLQLTQNGDDKALMKWSVEMNAADETTAKALEVQIRDMYASSAEQLEALASEIKA